MARSKTSNQWMREHVNDPYVQRAKAEGYRSRAAYKLMEIDAKDRLLRPGQIVVDLGATPGGWSQIAGRVVGPKGRVLAIDLLEMEPLSNVKFIQADFSEDIGLNLIEKELGGSKVDLVLSDMSPNISGIGVADQARSIGLAELALDFALKHLRPEGAFLVKCFQGTGFQELLAVMRSQFQSVVSRKPDASRGRSSEMYLLARRLREKG